MVDGQIVVACAEERLTRKKYANGWWTSLRYCLEGAGLRLEDVDLVVFSNAGPPLPKGFDAGLSAWAHGVRTATVDHHLSHAISAFVLSGHDEAVALVADAGGNDLSTESVFHVARDGVELLRVGHPGRPMASGLGPTYEAFTNFLGFTDEESGKTMGLAAYGDPQSFSLDLFAVTDDGRVSSDLAMPHFWGVRDLAERWGLDFGPPFPESGSESARNVAAFVQSRFAVALEQMLRAISREYPGVPQILSGGTALNCSANSVVRASGLDVFPSPLGSDTGLALGNAAYGTLLLSGQLPPLLDPSLRYGREYSAIDIDLALARVPERVQPGAVRRGELNFYRASDPVEVASDAIQGGAIVAWWQGRSELGPRALGARSLLASTKLADVRERINRQVKQREWFRPFGPSLLDSDARVAFKGDPVHLRYMNEAPEVLAPVRDDLRACVHVDGSARAQTVSDDGEDRYTQLLRCLAANGHRGVLNTSFNIQEPIVESPSDAVSTFLRSEIDLLVLDDFICTRVVP